MAVHWFDALNKIVIHGAPRRALLGAIAGTLGWVAFDDSSDAGKKRQRRKRQRQRKGEAKPRAQTCSHGACVDTRTDPDNCAFCGHREPSFLCCGGHLYDPTRQFCCSDGLRPCFTSQVCCTVGDDVPACCSPP